MQLFISNRDISFRKCFKALLQRDEINVSIQDGEKTNALHLLARFNGAWTFEAITQLIHKGIDTKVTDIFGYNVLHYFCQGLRLHSQDLMLSTVLRFLLKNCGCKINAQTNDGETALTLFCRNAQEEDLFEGVHFLVVECKADVNVKNLQGENALDCLSQNVFVCGEFIQGARLLIENGLDPGENTLHHLFKRQRVLHRDLIVVVRFLLSHGADVNSKTDNNSPLYSFLSKRDIHFAETKGVIALLSLFIESEFDFKSKNSDGLGILHLVCRFYLFDESNDEDDEDKRIESVKEVVDFLLVAADDVDINNKTSSGETVMHMLCKTDYPCIFLLRFFIIKKVDVRVVNVEQENALHLLCRHCQSENLIHFIRLLVKAGIDVKAKTKDGSSAAALLWSRRAEIPNVTGILQFPNSSQ